MCTAVHLAAALVALIAGLTLLRIRKPHSPGADLLAQALDGLGKDAPLRRAVPHAEVGMDTAAHSEAAYHA